MTTNPLNVKLQKTPPAQIDAICREVFGISGSAKSMASERDETILVEAKDGRNYVLKIANAAEDPKVLAFQTAGLLHLAAKSPRLPVPEVVLARDGSAMPALQIGGEDRLVRMLTYLQGTPLNLAPRSLPQLAALGGVLADLGLALADFAGPAPVQDLLWDLTGAGRLRSHLGAVAPERRAVVAAALDGFDRLATGPIHALPAQVIHNDFNPNNILTAPENPDRITGVIDFGDMVFAPLVCDLAVAMAYHVSHGTGFGAILSLLSGFTARRPLTPPELAALPALLRMRLAMTLLITEWRVTSQPENAPYILRNHAACWAGLQRLQPHADTALAEIFSAAQA